MEFGSQHERKQMRRVTEFEDGKRLLPKPKTRVELPFDVVVSILTRLPAIHLQRMRSVCRSWISLISDSRFVMEYSKFRTSVTRLPAIHLQRMRSVCRSWISLISDSRFVMEYSKFRTSVTRRPYIVSLYRRSLQNSYKFKFFPEGDDYYQEFDICRVFVGVRFCRMSNSCDGLICIAGDAFTYLVNPSIQKVGALPKRSWNFNIRSAGLGFNDSTGEYKVVRLFHRKVGQRRELGCEVYTVGNLHSPSCWKVVDSPPFEPIFHSLPIFVNGAIHWTISNGLEPWTNINGLEPWTISNGLEPWTINNGLEELTPEIVMSFDVKSEKFDVILHPEGSSRPPCSIVVELGGLLCLACTHCAKVQMDIWALKDYINREWIKQYSIDLSAMYNYYWNGFAFWNIPVTIHDGKIVFCNVSGWTSYYDPWSKSFAMPIRARADFGYDTAYAESIVWPTARI